MSVNQLLGEPPKRAEAALNPLVIPDIDTSPGTRDGLGWNELSDPERAVALQANLPTAIRPTDIVSLYWTHTQPITQPPEDIPAEDPVQFYVLGEDTIERGWIGFGVRRGNLDLPPEDEIPYPYFGYFYYSIHDPRAGGTRYSEYRKVLIDLRVPGGLDPNPESPVNENLPAPQVVPDVITPSTSVTVTVMPWQFMQPDDQLTLIWNGVRHIRPRLLAEEVGQPLEFLLPEEVLMEGGSGERLPVYYEIRDRVQNYSRPSPATYVEADIDPDALGEPVVEGAQTPPFELDLTPLEGKDVVVNVPLYQGVVVGDSVTLYWIGLTADGLEVPYQSAPKVIESDNDLGFEVPYPFAGFVVNGTARVYYESVPAGSDEARRSRTRRISVIGDVAELQAPTMDEAEGDIIDVSTLIEPQVHVRIARYPGQMAGDEVTLRWMGQASSGLPLVYEAMLTIPEGGERDELVFEVSQLYLKPLVDGKLTLSYSVRTPSLDIRRSSPERIYQVVDSGELELLAPTCAQLQGSGDDALLPIDTPDAIIEVPDTVRLRPGEPVTLHFAQASGSTPPPYEQTKTFEQFPFNFTVANADFLPFEGQDMSVTYSVDRGGVALVSPSLKRGK